MKHFVLFLAFAALSQAQVTKETVPGISNFARVETTVACAGVITPDSIAGIKKMGFASVIDLQMPTEDGVNIDAEAAAAKAAGIKFVHLPLNSAKPDPAVADKFLEVIAAPGTQPAFIHCHSGNRASAMWMIKRVLIDKWDVDRASEEAAQLGLTNAGLKKFALDYIAAHKQ